MAKPSMDVTSSVGKLLEEDDVDLAPGRGLDPGQALMETEVSSQIGARPYERSSAGTADRNGYRTRTWDTRVGTIRLKIPKGHRQHVPSPPCWSPADERRRPCGDLRGLRQRDLHPQVDDLVRALGNGRDLPIGGLPNLQGVGRGRED